MSDSSKRVKDSGDAFMEKAADAALIPQLCTRFQIFESVGGLKTIVVGGAATIERVYLDGSRPSEETHHAAVISSLLMAKNIAADLVLHLEHEFGIDDEYKAERRKQYPKLVEAAEATKDE